MFQSTLTSASKALMRLKVKVAIVQEKGELQLNPHTPLLS